MNTVLITGTNRGLGLEFVRQYAGEGWRVLACCRDPSTAKDLTAVAGNYPDTVSIRRLDVSNHQAIAGVAREFEDTVIDVLINNAAVYGSAHHQFNDIDYRDWMHTLSINTLAPMRMAQAFVRHVAAGEMRKMIFMTSKMGSMEDNSSGGSYLYRSSKAGLNAVVKSLTIDLRPMGISTLLLHPGWAKTDMGGPHALVSTQDSVEGMRRLIAACDLSNTGAFKDYQGNEIPW